MPRRPGHLRSKLRELGQAEEAGLRPAEALLLLGALDHPEGDLAGQLAFLDHLGRDLGARIGSDGGAEAGAGHLLDLLNRDLGFRDDDGDDDDLANINLMQVLERRRGAAAMLAVLAVDLARTAGLRAEMLAFPLHPLIRVQDGDGQRIILDVSAGGQRLDAAGLRALLKAAAGNGAELEPAHYAPLDNRAMVIRLRNEAKLRLLRRGRMDRALDLVEATLLVAPGAVALWREAGMIHLRLDHPKEAIAALEQFVTRSAEGLPRSRAQALLADIRGRLN